ncbi:ankyrin repeat domain-containing protein 40 isoform X3 [Osmerus eperlanus]|uniref:ankyrin repeat domain-containing protein 40 isoform X3 n=1 Tax=Osmerus eperlanus TaxID=29151 RepID=UPI002E1036CA
MTCLHWACKRNHKHVVSYLLNSGADKEILTAKDELAAQLTSKPEIKRLLGGKLQKVPEVKELELPFIPNYLSNPPFMYSKMDNKAELILNPLSNQNGSGGDHSEYPHSDPASLSPTHESQQPLQQQSLPADPPGPREGAFVPVSEQNGVSSSLAMHTANGPLPMDLSVEPHLVNHGEYPYSVTYNGPVCSSALPSPSPSTTSSGSQAQGANANASTNPSITRQQSVPQQLNCGQTAGGPMPAFQPFFFTSTFPVNVQELVLKVRIQNPNARENDFIEVELDRQELTYRALLRVCCRELDLSAEHVEKIRKLPNTMLRKDKDVARLQDFQELEVVLEKAEGLSLFSAAGSLTDRPCYNMKASRLTY